jgi:hypothetical protein
VASKLVFHLKEEQKSNAFKDMTLRGISEPERRKQANSEKLNSEELYNY